MTVKITLNIEVTPENVEYVIRAVTKVLNTKDPWDKDGMLHLPEQTRNEFENTKKENKLRAKAEKGSQEATSQRGGNRRGLTQGPHIRELAAKGKTSQEIADILGMKKQSVYNYCYNHKIKLTTRGE